MSNARRQTMFATGGSHSDIDALPVSVAKLVLKRQRAKMEERHAKQRQELANDIKRLQTRMNSEAFTSDIHHRLSNIRAKINKSPTRRRKKKSVRFAPNVKRDSKHRVMK